MTKLKIVCAWCGADLGEKDGQGVEGVTGSICQKCQKRTLASIGLRFPKPWNLVGRLIEHFRRRRIRKEKARMAAIDQVTPYCVPDPRFHNIAMIRGRPLVHFVDLTDLGTANFYTEAFDDPENSSRFN